MVLPLRQQMTLQNAVFCEERFGKNKPYEMAIVFGTVRCVHKFYR